MSKDLQKYFEYNPDESKWWLKEAPTVEPWFQEELNRFAGFNDRKPRLRIVWGGTILHDITEKPRLKYSVVRDIITGYNYIKTDGTIGVTKSMNLPNDARVPWEFHPKRERIELGRLRWAIEQHVPAHELRKLGRFQNRRAPDGELILRELPEEGVYDHYFGIETADRKYRAPDREVLTAVEAMYHYNTTKTEAQKLLDDRERAKQQHLIGAEASREIFQQL
jgi:hypothetical protein